MRATAWATLAISCAPWGGNAGHQAGCLLADIGQQFSHAPALGEQGDGGGGFDDNQLGLGIVGLGLFGHGWVLRIEKARSERA